MKKRFVSMLIALMMVLSTVNIVLPLQAYAKENVFNSAQIKQQNDNIVIMDDVKEPVIKSIDAVVFETSNIGYLTETIGTGHLNPTAEGVDDAEESDEISLFAANGNGHYVVTATTLNVRSGPGTEYSYIGNLNNGDNAYVGEVYANWGRINYRGNTDAWICLDHATWVAPLEPLGYSISSETTTAVVGDTVQISFTESYGTECTAYVYILRNGTFYHSGDIGESKSFGLNFFESGTYDVYLKLTNSSGTFTGSVGNGSVTIVVSDKTYTITYNANGGSGAPSAQTVTAGEYLTLSTVIPTRFGYNFIYWGTSADSSGGIMPGTSVQFTSSTTLYAIWFLPNEFNTTTYQMDSAHIRYAGECCYFTFTPSVSGTYYFESSAESGVDTCGYIYSSSGKQLAYNDDGGEYSNFEVSYSMTAGTTYYLAARYFNSSATGSFSVKLSRGYTVSYNTNGGSGAPSSQTKKYGTAFTLSSTVPTRNGYTFLGWSTSSTATSAVYQAGGTFTKNANTTLYAVWKANTYTVTYNYSYNGGSSATKTTAAVVSGETADLTPTASKSGWTFVGWSTSPTSTTALSSYTVTGDVTLYAIYKKTLTATFYSGNKSLQSIKTVVIYNNATSGSVTAPTPSSYSGWTVSGWRDDTTAGTYEYNKTASISLNSDKSFYATYYRTLTLSYNANGGNSTPSSQTATQYYNAYGTKQSKSFALASSISKTGCEFLSWAQGSVIGTSYNAGSSISISDDTTMYATWFVNLVATVEAPTITISDILGGKSATITCLTDGATIYYTTDGSDPNTNGNKYTGAISFNSAGTSTIKAIAVKMGYINSSVTSKNISLEKAAAPTSNYGETAVVAYGTDIVLTASKYSDHKIYYTTDKTTPSTKSILFNKQITLLDNVEIRAVTVVSGYANSDVTTFTYTIPEYVVTYNANGGIGGPSRQTKKYGQDLIISTDTPQKTGFIFAGWGKSSDTTVIAYKPGDTYSVEDDMQLYALWNKDGINYPKISVKDAEHITNTSAKLTGIIDDIGGDTIINKYIVYFEKNNPDEKYTISANSDFSVTVTNLKEGTEYCYYATANNSKGYGSSINKQFTTLTTSKPAHGTVGDVEYELKDGVLTITGSGSTGDVVTAPWADYAGDITEIIVSDGVTELGDSVFEGLSKVNSISLPQSLETIGENAFKGCAVLTSLTIPKTVDNIGKNSLSGCNSLKTLKIPFTGENVNDTENVFAFLFGSSAADIPASLEDVYITQDRYISTNDFANAQNIKRIVIESEKDNWNDRVTEVVAIGASAFTGCSSLESLTIKSNMLTDIGSEICKDCNRIEYMSVPFVGDTLNANGTPNSTFGYFFGYSDTQEVGKNTSQIYNENNDKKYYYIPNSLKTIEITGEDEIPYGAFMNMYSVESIDIYTSAVINAYAFHQCGLTYAVLPYDLKELGEHAFANCKYLEAIRMPDNENELEMGKYVFYNCYNLERVIIPGNVKLIESNTFSGCSNVSIYGYNETYAQDYADTNGISFVLLDSDYTTDDLDKIMRDEKPDGTISLECVCYTGSVAVKLSEPCAGILAAAVYDDAGRLVQVVTKATNDSNADYELSVSGDVKVMLWNSMTDMVPLAQAWVK